MYDWFMKEATFDEEAYTMPSVEAEVPNEEEMEAMAAYYGQGDQ